MIRWDSFAKLLQCPCRCWVIGNIGMYQFSRFNLYDYKHIEKLECRCNHGQKITGNDCLGMIGHEGGPALIATRLSAWALGMYFRTVRAETRIPSLSKSSLAMRSSPQDGLLTAISRISRPLTAMEG